MSDKSDDGKDIARATLLRPVEIALDSRRAGVLSDQELEIICEAATPALEHIGPPESEDGNAAPPGPHVH